MIIYEMKLLFLLRKKKILTLILNLIKLVLLIKKKIKFFKRHYFAHKKERVMNKMMSKK